MGKRQNNLITTTIYLERIILFLRLIHSHRGVLSDDPPDAPRAAVIVLRLCKLLALGVDEPDGGAGDSRLWSDGFDGFIDRFNGASSWGSLTAAATAAAAAAANEDAIDEEDFALRFKPAHSLIGSDMASFPAEKRYKYI